ncbi:MAG: amidohydrolase family protein [Halodesulfurarchaeum sp.]
MTDEVDPEPPDEVYPDCRVIDAHIHVFPDELFEAIYGWFRTETEWTIPELDAETIIDRLQSRTDGFVFFPYAHKPGIAVSLNEAVESWNSRLGTAAALGTVHAADDRPGQIVEDALDGGLTGIKLHCPVQGYAPDDERLDPVYEVLVDRDAPLVMHASTHPFDRGDPALQPERLESVLRRFPSLRVALPHLGLFGTDTYLDLAETYAVYFDTAVALGSSARDLVDIRGSDLPVERLREKTDRIMFGSDYPLTPLTYEDGLRGVTTTFPDPDDRQAVFADTARAFFDLPF